ncbi:hypothetical protein NECAME_05484 [Necator americanus]|uniref:Uncharacterized protein n=1 Tax=Necator americanus TaxID=51031 RepID=W2SGM1_NECAM|nr:hypothetical protein NECAME_05484 [Necator americanus]ETN68759.1 hypothetical protein NECAME_05484 [Necator americanus]
MRCFQNKALIGMGHEGPSPNEKEAKKIGHCAPSRNMYDLNVLSGTTAKMVSRKGEDSQDEMTKALLKNCRFH